MRVLIVSDCYAPRLGGIETQVRDLARNLRLAGHEPAVVTATPVGDGRGRSVERADGFPVYRTTAHLPSELPVHPRAGRELDDLLSRLRPDVVHAHSVFTGIHVGRYAAERWGAALAITEHRPSSTDRSVHGWRYRALRRDLRRAPGRAVVSTPFAEVLRDYWRLGEWRKSVQSLRPSRPALGWDRPA